MVARKAIYGCVALLLGVPRLAPGVPADPYEPPLYAAYRTNGGIEIDGKIDEADWNAASWTDEFIDIRGEGHSVPRFRTRAKLLWDDRFLYVAAELEEPQVWATFTERDSRIYHDNAFEVFIDPDGDTHNYYELEINALGTVWDLLLIRPSRDGGPSLSAWDIRELQARVHVNGTLNQPLDTDSGWTVEMALPWSVLREAAPERRLPRDGEHWRFNFARSQWTVDVVEGAYRKNDEQPADWWVWSSQGAVDMHRPERFGYVFFAGDPVGTTSRVFTIGSDEGVKRALRELYFRQRAYFRLNGRYADSPTELSVASLPFEATIRTTQTGFEITTEASEGRAMHINQDGRVWTSR